MTANGRCQNSGSCCLLNKHEFYELIRMPLIFIVSGIFIWSTILKYKKRRCEEVNPKAFEVEMTIGVDGLSS